MRFLYYADVAYQETVHSEDNLDVDESGSVQDISEGNSVERKIVQLAVYTSHKETQMDEFR